MASGMTMDRQEAACREGYDQLKVRCKEYEVLKLHIGCGPRILKGWVNIDLSYEPYDNYLKYYKDKYYPPNARGDRSDFYAIDIARQGLPLLNNTVDVIFHEDFIEHLNQRDQIIFLAESLRVLRPGCIHRVNTPDLSVSMNIHSNFPQGRQGVFTDEWDKHHHINVLTLNILRELALLVGYSQVVFNERDKSIARGIPPEYRPDPTDRDERGNIYADLIK